jgi:predicted metalloprotease with PDZ domain
VFHDIPWKTYTVLEIADAHPNGGGLEHQDSQVDEIGPDWLDLPFLAGLYSHEMFHSWNVKRLRPADMVPYRYDDAQPTQWLWVSEGITDYYSYLANMRSGISDSAAFLDRIAGNISGVSQQPPTALADASLQPWIDPTDGSAGIYYPKGALAGYMLDLMIRDASDNRHSLDDVMRTLYETTYKKGKGFTPNDWWTTVSQAAGGRSFDAVNRRFIEGRDPYPWDSVLALAGLALKTDSARVVIFGVQTAADSLGIRVTYVVPGGASDRAGIKQGDVIVSLGDVVFSKYPSFGAAQAALRERFPQNTQAPYTARRAGETVTGTFPVEFQVRTNMSIMPVPGASKKALEVRHGLFTGTTP